MSFWRGREGYRSEVREEIQFHLDMRAKELEGAGKEPVEARGLALESFGDPDTVEFEILEMKEHRRNLRPLGEILASIVQDVRYAGRFLRRDLVFTAAAVATLAFGIGANTAIFSMLDATLLRSPGVADPGSVVAVYTTSRLGAPRSSTSYRDYLDYREFTASLTDLAATSGGGTVNLMDEAGASLVEVEAVTGNYFSLLGVTTELGRPLQPDDDVLRAGAPVAVISHALWRDRFGSDPEIIGRVLRMNGRAIEVVGVARPSFNGLSLGEDTGAWLPLQTGAVLSGYPDEVWDLRGIRWMGRLVGRLASGATVEQARAELVAVSDRLREEDPEGRGARSITVDPLGSYLAPIGAEESLPQFVWLLMGVVGSTLLLACANLAGLQLTRASARRGEIGVRIALGAGRGRLMRQLFSESLLLAGVGGAFGLVVAIAILRALGSYELPGGLVVGSLTSTLDYRILAATGVFALLTAVLTGLVPALQSTGPEVALGLHRGESAGTRRGAGRLRRGLVAVQVALCFVLLAGSGLFVRSLRTALGSDLGFDPDHVAVGTFDLRGIGYGGPDAVAFANALRDEVLALPGVQAAALGSVAPFSANGFSGVFATVDGYEPSPDEEIRVDQVFTTPGYFETLGVRLLSGRDFRPEDSGGSVNVAVVSRTMAERYWPAGEAEGKVFRFESGLTNEVIVIEVVGVVEDVHWRGIEEEATNFAFLPAAQHPNGRGRFTVLARTVNDAESVLPGVREAIERLEGNLSLEILSTMDQEVGQVLMPQRVGSVLLSGFGALALLLSAVGVFGLVSYTVREQRRAIGVRMAVGARRSDVVREVALGMVAPLVIGLTLGLMGGMLVDDAAARFLYGVAPGDPVTYGAIAGALFTAMVISTILPARQAAHIDAMRALRSE